MNVLTADQIERVARITAAYPFKVWGFGESIAMEALLAAGGAAGEHARDLLRRWALEADSLSGDPLAHVAPGVPLLRLYRELGDARLLRRALELAEVLVGLKVGVHGARIHRPDLHGWEHEVWVDCMHLDGPFLAHLGEVTGSTTWHDAAAELLLTHARVLQDERSGLFSHGFDDASGEANHVFWGRGQGWALLGLVDTARALPAEHPARGEIVQRLHTLLDGLARNEADSGRWFTVVDHQETYLEPSVGAFVTLGVSRALSAGLVSPTGLCGAYALLAERAWAATAAQIGQDGALEGVSDATPVGATVDHYAARGRGVFPWGQGPALLAALEREG